MKSLHKTNFEPFRVKRKKRVKQKLHKQKRRNVYTGKLYAKKDLLRPRPSWWYIGINMTNYGAAIASTKTHKRNNKH